jgi:hypothetical protein
VESPLRQLDPDNFPPAQARQQIDKIAEALGPRPWRGARR